VARDPLLTPTRLVEAADGRPDFLRRLRGDDELWRDFHDLCDCGGRLAGSASEARAQDWCAARLSAAGQGAPVRRDSTPYAGWICHGASLTHLASGQRLDAIALLGTARTAGTELEVLDLGRGTPEQIQAAGDRVRGRAVMVAHEYPFATSTVHRRVKLAAAQAAGAAAFLVAQPETGVGPISGSSGRGGGPGIPAMGISAEAAQMLRGPGARVRIEIDGEDLPGARTDVIVLDLPGGSDERVVLSAHIDGHPLAESAIDNGTGVAAVLALARNIAPFVAGLPRGLTVCIFSAEEWALNGSREWLRGLPAAERERIVLNVNLDSLAGSNRLTALTSDFPRLGSFAQAAAGQADTSLAVHLPLMSNSDHANFAAHGIPALRLIAGFDEPASALRLLLSRADTRELVDRHVLQRAAACAGSIVWSGLSASAADLHHLRSRA
jgi:Zn-dependent M28 family amino/carboxypeptidase